MKKVTFLLSLFGLTAIGLWYFSESAAPQAQGYPHPKAMDEFITLCGTESFQDLHEDPIAYLHRSDHGEDITYPVAEGEDGQAFYLKAKTETNRYVFVIHEWWGLNGHIRAQAEELFEALEGKVHVLALDLYDGEFAETRDDAIRLVRSKGADTDRLFSLIEGARAFAGDDAEIGTIGWCFGGGWSLQASLALGEQAAGCVVYYGRPETDVERLKTLQAPVLGIFGTQDGGIPPATVAQFEKDMATADKSIVVHNFEAGHGFANPSNPNHVEDAANEAWGLAVTFLKTQLSL